MSCIRFNTSAQREAMRHDAAALAGVMTQGRFRHLPVVVDGKLAGIVSIGDLVKTRIDMLEQEREQLQSYIAS